MRALISVGTNTTRLLVVRDEPDGGLTQLEHAATGTRLGEGLTERGTLAKSSMERTLAVVAEFATRARAHSASVDGIATSAMRRASNGDEFVACFQKVSGVPLRVIGGDDEAAYSYAGATYGLPHGGTRVAVLDIGGGSTECALGRNAALERAVSCEIGSVRLTERYPALGGRVPGAAARADAEEARAAASGLLRSLDHVGEARRLLAVAGTATTLAAIAFGSDVDHVRGFELSEGVLHEQLDRMLDASLDERRAMPGMLPQRADILPAGAIILLESMKRMGLAAVTVETNDLLLGYLLAPERAAGSAAR